jgi:hypothetical protein
MQTGRAGLPTNLALAQSSYIPVLIVEFSSVPIENVSQHTGAPLNPSAATSGPAQDHFSANLNGDVLLFEVGVIPLEFFGGIEVGTQPWLVSVDLAST